MKIIAALFGVLLVLQPPETWRMSQGNEPYESTPDPQGRFIERLKFDRGVQLFQQRLLGTPFRYDA